MSFLRTKNNVITYTVNKAMNQDLYISVQNGEVVINAPWYTTSAQIQKMVEQKKQWIMEKLAEYEERCSRKKEYAKAKQVKLLGKYYELEIQYRDKKSPELNIEKAQIKIVLPTQYKKLDKEEILSMLIAKMYHTVTKREIEMLMEETRLQMGLAPEDYTFMKSDKVLAKCENGTISINENIAMYAPEIIRYVVLHEFCHLKYKNHTKSFYMMLETYMPEYKEYVDEISHWQY